MYVIIDGYVMLFKEWWSNNKVFGGPVQLSFFLVSQLVPQSNSNLKLYEIKE